MEGSIEGANVSYQYTGQEYEGELDLHNYRARFYDSDLMRFYAVDPAMEFASPYLYCGNNPILFVDPTGNITAEVDEQHQDAKKREEELIVDEDKKEVQNLGFIQSDVRISVLFITVSWANGQVTNWTSYQKLTQEFKSTNLGLCFTPTLIAFSMGTTSGYLATKEGLKGFEGTANNTGVMVNGNAVEVTAAVDMNSVPKNLYENAYAETKYVGYGGSASLALGRGFGKTYYMDVSRTNLRGKAEPLDENPLPVITNKLPKPERKTIHLNEHNRTFDKKTELGENSSPQRIIKTQESFNQSFDIPSDTRKVFVL